MALDFSIGNPLVSFYRKSYSKIRDSFWTDMDKNPDSITQTNSGCSRHVCMALNARNDALNTFYEYCNTCVMFFGGIFYVLAQIHLGAEHPTLGLKVRSAW